MHKAKFRKRGYNQAGEFAKGLSLVLNIPLQEGILGQEVLSVSQIEKTRTVCYDSVKNVFAHKSSDSIKSKHILLVDEVLTTDATICEAASLIIENDATVSIATITRA